MKKGMRMLACAFALLLTASGVCMNVRADVVYEPIGAGLDFYSLHAGECVEIDRSYLANGPSGSVKVYKSPENAKVEGTIPNGEQVYVSYMYSEPDADWCCIEYSEGQVYGWVPMAYMQEKFDGAEFWEQYGEEFVNENWELDEQFFNIDIYEWEIPGDPNTAATINVTADDMMGGYTQYTDEYGNVWGYFSYYMAVSGWICLNNPTASYDELYPDGGPAYEVEDSNASETAAQQSSTEEIVPASGIGSGINYIVIIGILVAAVAVLTIVLLILLGKKKKTAKA